MPNDFVYSANAVDEGPEWWKEAIIYQVYPHSFCDSNGDGIGDLNGVRSKLDYLKKLGVDVVWLSPIYSSPQKDMGYDISDYRAVHEKYGTMEDFEALLKGLHDRGMKLMMDLVVNHTSDQHEWFKESRSSKTNPKRDWYIWRPPRYDSSGKRLPPNNWLSAFRGASAWSWDEETQEYYLRIFTHEQPDLNWENQEVRQAVYEMMRWWLAKGVDGFRMDVINLLSKRPGLPDAPEMEQGRFLQPAWGEFANGPRIHEFLKEMHREVLSGRNLITVGETPFTHDIDTLVKYVKPEEKELQMVFTFELHDIDGDAISPLKPKPFELLEFKRILAKYQVGMLEKGGWNSLYFENHDQARSVNRFGNASAEYRALSAKLLALCHLTLSGTAYIYQGQELAMANLPKDCTIEQYPDVQTRQYWNEIFESRREDDDQHPDMGDVIADLNHKARDNARTPMQWTAEPHAGFSRGEPWMRVSDDYRQWNADSQVEDAGSVWTFWRDTIRLRKSSPACTYGRFKMLSYHDPKVFAYRKVHPEQTLLVALNFSQEHVFYSVPLEAEDCGKISVLHGNYETPALPDNDRRIGLRPYEAVVYLLS